MSVFSAVFQVMEEIRNVITHSSSASSSSLTLSAQASRSHTSQGFQQKSADDSLIQVIEKLSKIVEKRPQRRCASGGQKRGLQVGERGAERGSRGSSACKRTKSSYKEEVGLESSTADSCLSSHVSGDDGSVTSTIADVAADPISSDYKRTVTCYQCSLCPYLSHTLPLLKEHLKQHNEQHSELILMCSECHFTSTDHEQLEAHVRMHFDNGDGLQTSCPGSETKGGDLKPQDGDWTADCCNAGPEGEISPVSSPKELPQKKKWYRYEEYGLYRCLICSYVCSQQRMLKTHAWKHAGLVDCSYPIFEDEDGASAKREASSNAATREEIVVLQDKSLQKLPTAFKLQLCMPVAVEDKQEVLNRQVSDLSESLKTEEDEYPIKDLTSEEPVVEVQVTTEAETEVEVEGHQESTSVADSLLSSAQKIINSSPNSAGHINVIVERLPSAEDSVMASNPLLLSPDVDTSLLQGEADEQDRVEAVKDEVVLCYGPGNTNESQLSGADSKSSVTKSSDPPRDENVPPAGRKRTHSESLRLHSLAAEALVAMPMRTPELAHSSTRASVKTPPTQSLSPQAGQKATEAAAAGQKASDVGTSLVSFSEGRERDLGSLGLGKGDEDGPAANVGISLSLLTVIERLRERSDQNASDEDILKELQDNAQFQNGAGVVAGNGAGSYVCSVPGMDGLVGSPDGSLVDYIPGSERPYRCRLCRYSSGNKGYIKQHLRVHRQRQPYQCPICEHIASDSKDLENHMIHHCKSRMYQCKQCPDAFHYKVRLCRYTSVCISQQSRSVSVDHGNDCCS